MIRAAGVMLCAPGGEVLFIQRGSDQAMAGTWAFPGGHVEDGETAEQAAERELKEEIGPAPYDRLQLWMRRIKDDGSGEVDFTTFAAKVHDKFAPALNEESTGYAWAKPDAAPQPLHPGAAVALARFDMDELGVAKAIAAGDLTSPQRYGNFWLWALRITGTGAAYRDARNEYCWRPAEIYLTAEFLERCNGLPVVFVHPEEKPKLDSEEFHNRIVGTVFVPFMRNDEVWAVCRIYDEATVDILQSEKFSTSPGVVFGPDSGNQTLRLTDGSNLLIEGKPALLDHIALVQAGVWDRGGEPSGVETLNNSVSATDQETLGMTEEEKAAAEKARSDANAKLDAMLGRLDSMHTRMDAMEESDKRREEERKDRARLDAARKDRFGPRKDAESEEEWRARHDADEMAVCDALRKDGADETKAREDARRARHDAEDEERRERDEKDSAGRKDAAETEEEKRALEAANAAKDAARKDAETKAEEEKAREDRARKDAAMTTENADLRRQLADLTRIVKGLTTETTPADQNALAAAQARADGIAGLFGTRASPPMLGESPLDYRRRLAVSFKKNSPKFKDKRIDSFDADMLEMAEEVIYTDSADAARSPERGPAGVLIPIREPDDSGRMITRWTGDSMAWRQYFMTGAQVGRIKHPSELRL